VRVGIQVALLAVAVGALGGAHRFVSTTAEVGAGAICGDWVRPIKAAPPPRLHRFYDPVGPQGIDI
jgi:hypothetical protein